MTMKRTEPEPDLSCGGGERSGRGREAPPEAMLEHFAHEKTILSNMA